MTDMTDNRETEQAREALRRWTVPASHAVRAGFLLQLAGVGCWIAIAFGIAITVGAASQGQVALHGLPIAVAGILIRAIAGWLAEEQVSRAGREIVAAARAEILDTVAQHGPAWLHGESHGARTSQIIDRTRQLHGHAARWLPGIQLSVAGPVLVLAAVATQSWLAATLLLVSVMVLPVFIWLTASGTAAEARTQQSALDHLSGDFQARAAQSGLIRAFRAVGRESAEIAARAQTLRERTMAVLRIAFLSTAVLEFFTSVSIALVAVYIGFKLLGVFPFATGETLTLTEGLAALMLAPEFFAPIRRLSGLHHDRSDAAAAARFLSGWLARKPEPGKRHPPLREAPLIRFDAISLAWPDGTIAVRGLSLTARPGAITALTGPSGAGKSSVLLALLGHVRPVHGQISVDARRLVAGESLADSTAYIGQTPWLMEGTVGDNIAVASPEALSEDLLRAARLSGLPGAEDTLDRPLARFGAGLSGGQRQRVALARALVRKSPLLLLDEPTAHLDAQAEAEFIALIKALSPGRTILLATHSPALRMAADHCVALPVGAREASRA